QRALLPRIINHPATQTTTILISVLLTVFNFFSWIVLASDKEAGAKTTCTTGPLSNQPGYAAQCRGVNVAIVFDVIVFLFWIPISLVIVCGTIERGLWWWGEDDGWAQGETIVGGSNMMSEEEFDMKIGIGGSKHLQRRQTRHPDNLESQQRMTIIQQPKPAFVTPIASQFRSQSSFALNGSSGQDNGDSGDGDDDDFGNFTPSSYRRHHQQRQQRQNAPKTLHRRASNTSLSSRLSSFFGTGWAAGTMPPTEAEPPMPELPSQYRKNNNLSTTFTPRSVNSANNDKEQTPRKKEAPKQEAEPEPEPAGLLHGDAYSSQWHSRWS
ncbi:hypothetical protein BGZ65_010419, partial [Modicella reniformis]